ncbi:PREDICTED: CASP8-associated protein 2 [Gekko japonicus]|uniref:CASP8-associated protein 2 n=1 Tax=Gekko japonicus TaxID=146911 RepID=A0ABM1KD70_GEKJA|nr:PREDICTED: CASP8-associated protein 2 [Gekko japonicus]XP_015271657.1 PREDICTED: CASP8-associated protein 2 [Gekko japonicus]
MATEEDDDDDAVTFSSGLCGVSPGRREDNDESSVDIYDGLDNTPIVFDSLATKATPTGSSLNLFDEILIAEGTAKETSYNDLQAKHEKCLQQLQELMKKLQEIQEQNSALQKENQSLKKNISALIKTARVEINRKDEEISNLQRRLLAFPVHQIAYSRTYFAAPINNNARNFVGLEKNKCKDLLLEKNPKIDSRTKPVIPKDVPHSYLSCDTENQKIHSEKRNTPYVPRPHPELLHSDADSRLTNSNNSSDKEKGKKEIRNDEHHSKENDCRHKNKRHENMGSITDGKLQVKPEKTVGPSKDNKNSKLKSSPYLEQRTDTFPSPLEKQPLNDRLPSKTEYSGNVRSEKSQNIKQKDLKTQNKDESSSGQKTSPERNLEQKKRKGNNISGPPEKISSAQKSSKSYVEDKKVKDSSNRKNRGTNNHEFQKKKLLSPCPPTSSKKHKHSYSKEESSKHEVESMHSKSKRHRTEEKRENKRVTLGESKTFQTERTDSKELPQRTAKVVNKVKDCTVREKNQPFPSQETTKVAGGSEEQKPTKIRRDEDQSKSKDLKLSFMQKLNLTLSPAKKQTGELRQVGQSPSGCDGEIPGKPISTTAAKQKTPPSVPIPDIPVPANSKQVVSISDTKAEMGTESLSEILSTESSKETSNLQNTVQCELVDNPHEASNDIGEAEETLRLPSMGSPLNQDTLPDDSFNDLEIINSVDFDSYSVIDEISGTDSDSLMEVEDTGNCEDEMVVEHPGKENNLPEHVSQAVKEEPKVLSRDVSVTDQKSCNSKLSCLDQGSHLEKLCNKGVKSAPLASDAYPVSVDDENSVLSIDLNHMRCIPKAISPLNSPIRPLTKALRGESHYTGPVKSFNTDLMPESSAVCPARSLSSELNKENQKPFGTDPQVLETESQLSVSSDELEEGEIVSDDDNCNSERNSEYSKKSRGKSSSEKSSLINSPHNPKPKTISYDEDKEKMVSAKNSKKNPRIGTVKSSKETKKNKAVKTDYLEKIVQIIAEPSTVHEFMQMLKAIRKQVRKNYMKFKVQFPVQHFHRIIDSAISNFTSLVKYLNFSKMSKSNETLKLNLCEVIESRLKRIKRNSTVDHLFEQQQSDMKKKLWKLVDEQLDNLFDKIKKIVLKLCNLINTGNENGDGKCNKRIKESPKCLIGHKTGGQNPKKQSLNARTQKAEERVLPKPVVGNQMSRRSPHDTNKMDAQKNTLMKCTSSYTDNAKQSQTRVELVKEKSIQDTESALKTGKYEKEGSQLVENSHKSDVSCGPLTEQQMSGLTFNLVNDAQMGEMFKSLLQGSDFSEKNEDFMDENQWEFRTPEKQLLNGQNCGNDTVYEAEESFPKETRIESRILDDIKWPVVSPERDSTFLTRLPMPVDPDILDENCMFDIPSSPALKKSEACILEKPKSLVSSILLEDLAVSLTIPSPLKSDAHLSFLKPNMFGSVPEDVLSAHFSEDAHLEEEDASEQDIHLALESDNSSSKSSCSSSWTSMPAAPGFQYCTSLPMQAVIMEKSNDHFIVKIRRTIPSTSPHLDQASLANDSMTSFIERGNDESVSEEKLDTLNPKDLPLEEMALSKEQNNITDSENKVHDDIEKQHILSSFEATEELLICHENHQQVPELSEFQQESNPSAPDNMLESVKGLLSNARQEQDCNMPEPLHEPPSNTSQHQGTVLIENQVLHNSTDPKEASDLPDPPVGKSSSSLVSFIDPSNKTCHGEDVPNVFKLPQTHSLKVLQKREVSCVTAEQLPINSAVVPLIDVFSSEGQFAVDIDLTNESPMENEVDSWDLTAESALNAGIGSLHKEEHEPASLLKCDVDAVTDLTADLPDKPTADENIERKTALNIGNLVPGKESKKRKREIEETSSIKIQRKSSELPCKKSGKNSKKSKETMSVAKSSSSKKAAPVRDKDSSPSASSAATSSLYAKNIIKKKGEVIISWTRNDDREILLECQKKGPSEKTFSSVAAKINKSSNQVEERFKQLVKLFNMRNCS